MGCTAARRFVGPIQDLCSQGLVTLTCGTFGNVLRFLPSLAISDALLAEGLDILEAAFAARTGR